MRVGTKLADVVKKYRVALAKARADGAPLPVFDEICPLDQMKVLQRRAHGAINVELEALPDLIEAAQEAFDDLQDALELLALLAEGEIAIEKLDGQRAPAGEDAPSGAVSPFDGAGLNPDRGLAISGGGEA